MPGEPVLARVEVFPFGHVVRAGSRLRVWVEAPTALPQLWAFQASPVPTQVSILHDAAHPSALVLPLVPNDAERIAATAVLRHGDPPAVPPRSARLVLQSGVQLPVAGS